MLTNKEKETIEELYFQNFDIIEISRMSGIKYQGILKYIRERELKAIKCIQEKNKLLYLCNEKKMTRQQIADILHIKPTKVTMLMKKHEIIVNFKQKKKEMNETAIIETYHNEPLSVGDMCRKLSLSYAVVHRVYVENNFAKVKPKEKSLLVLSNSQYYEIIKELIETDRSLQEIANKYNVSRQRIHQIQKSNGIIRKRRN